jgi:hypothetical protein
VVALGDGSGARLTIQALRLYHPEVAEHSSFVVIDDCFEGLAAALEHCVGDADADVVCCIDSYVLLAPGALAAMLTFFDAHPESELHGPGLVARGRDAPPDRRVVRHPAVVSVRRPAINPFSCFDGILCLNLDSATDRWRDAARRHARLGIAERVERFPAVATPDNPHRGIAASFRNMVAEAKRRGWRHVLVLEDDAVFLDDARVVMRSVAAELDDHDWDLCYLGACVWSQQFPQLGDSTVLQACGPVTCTHAIAFHRRAYDRLLSAIPVEAAELDRFLRDYLAIDQYLCGRIANGTYRALITSPRVASQPNLLEFDDGDGALAARYVI